jgi:hypothetical protein
MCGVDGGKVLEKCSESGTNVVHSFIRKCVLKV